MQPYPDSRSELFSPRNRAIQRVCLGIVTGLAVALLCQFIIYAYHESAVPNLFLLTFLTTLILIIEFNGDFIKPVFLYLIKFFVFYVIVANGSS